MFIGHFAVALAAKRATPRTSLGWLFAACQLSDLIWPVLLLAGVESAHIEPGNTAATPLAFDHYPWSHSLLMTLVWGLVLGGIYLGLRGDRRAALVIAVVVVTHWVLDWISHRPDLPLTPWSSGRVGLGLWNSIAATVIVEGLLFAIGVWIYSRITTPRDRTGRVAWVSLALFLVLIYVANIFGPPPKSMTAVAVSALAIWLLVWWAAWADAHREVRVRADGIVA
jgi:membrane-bound metal-dependent hydrolase YbcI (DUF457 family)